VTCARAALAGAAVPQETLGADRAHQVVPSPRPPARLGGSRRIAAVSNSARQKIASKRSSPPRGRRGLLGLRHPNRKPPREPQGKSIKCKENDEAGVPTKLALDNEPDEISREATRDQEGDVVED